MPKDKIFDAIFPPGNTTVTHEKIDGLDCVSFVSPALPEGTPPRDVKIVRARRKGKRKPKPWKYISGITVKE